MDDSTNIHPLLKAKVYDVLSGEEMVYEVAREMIKDELKAHIRQILDEDPELKQELRDAVGMYFEAKVKEAYANIKLAKAGAKLGLRTMPEPLAQDMKRELEKEMGEFMEKIL